MATATADTVTRLYRQRLIRLRDDAALLAVHLWLAVDIDNPATVSAFARAGEAAIGAAQRQVVTISDAYVAAFVSSELRRSVPPVGLSMPVGFTADGKRIGEVMTRAAIVARHARSGGATLSEARDKAGRLLLRRVRTEVVETGRAALRGAMTASPHVHSYEVVTSPGRCEICARIAAGGTRPAGERIQFHDHCRCSLRPVVNE